MRIEENDVIQFTEHKTVNYVFVLFLNNLYLLLVVYVLYFVDIWLSMFNGI